MDLQKDSLQTSVVPLLNDVGLGRSSWLKSIPHYTLIHYTHCVFGMPLVTRGDLLKSGPGHTTGSHGEREAEWRAGHVPSHLSHLPVAGKLLRLKKILAKVFGMHSKHEPGSFWVLFKAVALGSRETALILSVRKHLAQQRFWWAARTWVERAVGDYRGLIWEMISEIS